MKYLLFCILASAPVFYAGCSKKTASSSGASTVYKGVVTINMCGNIAIETLGPDYLGENSWSAGSGSPVYHNIFTVQNACQFGVHPVGDTISFKVVASQTQNCAQCMAYVAVPPARYPIQVIK